MQVLVDWHTQLNPKNKLLIYKTIIKPMWTYGIELWGTSANSYVKNVEVTQSIILCTSCYNSTTHYGGS